MLFKVEELSLFPVQLYVFFSPEDACPTALTIEKRGILHAGCATRYVVVLDFQSSKKNDDCNQGENVLLFHYYHVSMAARTVLLLLIDNQ